MKVFLVSSVIAILALAKPVLAQSVEQMTKVSVQVTQTPSPAVNLAYCKDITLEQPAFNVDEPALIKVVVFDSIESGNLAKSYQTGQAEVVVKEFREVSIIQPIK